MRPFMLSSMLVLASCACGPDQLEDAGVKRDAGSRVDSGVHLDGGSSVDGGARLDAGGSLDGGVSVDAGQQLDAGGTVVDGGTWCTNRAVDFCEDFDVPAFSSTAWGYSIDGASGTGLPPGGLITAEHTSAPNSFAASTPQISSGATISQLQKSTGSPDSPNHVDAEFALSVRIASLCSGSRTEIARIEGVNPINFASYGFSILVSASGAAIELTQGSKARVTTPLSAAPATGVWTRIVLRLGMERVVTGPPTSISVKIGEGAAETFSLDPGMGVRPFVKLGLHVTGPSIACAVDYDDFTHDAL